MQTAYTTSSIWLFVLEAGILIGSLGLHSNRFEFLMCLPALNNSSANQIGWVGLLILIHHFKKLSFTYLSNKYSNGLILKRTYLIAITYLLTKGDKSCLVLQFCCLLFQVLNRNKQTLKYFFLHNLLLKLFCIVITTYFYFVVLYVINMTHL